jgi:DNA repair exonuclease SbcCD ATPase subunit
MTKIKTLAEEEMDSHKHWTKNLYEIKPGVWVPKNNTRGPLDLEQRIADLTKRLEKAEANRPLDTMDEIAYRELEKENKDLELALQRAQERVGELNTSLAEALAINEAHQKQIGKLQVRLTEVEEDNKKLAKQIENQSEYVQKLRDKGGI